MPPVPKKYIKGLKDMLWSDVLILCSVGVIAIGIVFGVVLDNVQ